MRYAKGIMWLDDCRIPFVDEGEDTIRGKYENKVKIYDWNNHRGQMGSFDDSAKQGRFTPNLLVCDDMLNDGVISKSTIFDGKLPNIKGGRFGASDIELTDKRAFGGFNDSGSSSRYYDLDKWFDKIIDEIQ